VNFVISLFRNFEPI